MESRPPQTLPHGGHDAGGVAFEWLADRPDQPIVAQQVGRWYHQAWAHLDPQTDEQQRIERVASESARRDDLPLYLLAVDVAGRAEGAAQPRPVLGVAQLKIREMTIYPEKEHWLGGVFVAPEARGRSVASRLADQIARIANQRGIRELYLQTEALNGGLYARVGWRPLEKVIYRRVPVLVMVRHL